MKKNSISQKQLREFGILVGFGSLIIWGGLVALLRGHLFNYWSLWVGIPSLIIGILKPQLLFYPYKAWIAIGLALGFINSYVILGSIFLIVLQPIALIMKICGHDPLRKKKNDNISYRENKQNHKVDLTRIF